VRIFTRYILREIVGYAFLGGVLFTFILFMRYLLPLMELAVRGIATPADIVRLVTYLLPNFITFTLPMAVLVGILLGLSRLAADSEVTAMRASGVGVLAFLRIVSILAVICWGIGLFNALYVAPRASQALLHYEDQSKTTQASIEVQPRVFYEDFKNYVLYVQDVVPGPNGTALWKHVFLADLTTPASPHIISSNEAVVISSGPQTLRMDLTDGSRHDTVASNPSEYDISTFRTTELPIQTGQQEEDSHITRRDTPTHALPLGRLYELANTGPSTDARPYLIEFYSRFAGPTACLVLMLVGVPLGLSSRRGGKGSGFVLTLLLVFLYYILSASGIALARQGKVPPILGVWGANLIFAVVGILLLQQMSRGGFAIHYISSLSGWVGTRFDRLVNRKQSASNFNERRYSGMRSHRLRRALHIRFPLILDEYVMGSTFRNFLLVISSLVVLFLIFTFFELIGDIIKNRTPLVTVGEYLLNLIPFILYNVTPLSTLIAVLITFGTLNRTSELTAMKATGTSLYRVVAPVILLAAVLATALFAFDEVYLPGANRRQEALLSVIKDKQAQTFLDPARQWMSGQTSGDGEPTRVFYYQYFDPDKNTFDNITVFEFQPGTFTLTRRIFAESASWDDKVNGWVFEKGWQRTFSGPSISSYQPFTVSTFPAIHEQPGYFKKEDRQSQEMSYPELSSYINDLKQSGFDTMRLRVQLYRKLAYPAITLIMGILAIPFALVAGKRGSLAGLGTAIGVAIAYWIVAAIFENLGDVNSLPAVLAAWSPDMLFFIAGSYLLLRTPT
jgi:LPS export ABC transporter permease LptG/LPS export ABC transporter permease LptF